MQRTGYRSYWKENYGEINPNVNGGISVSTTLKGCIEQTVSFLARHEKPKPFVVHSYEFNSVVYNSETGNTIKGEEKMAEKTLYEIKCGDETLFGHKLAVNSQGQWVMEVKGSGNVFAADKSTVSEVIPYTVGIKFAQQGQVYNYFDEKRQVNKGDVLVMDGYGSGGYQLAIVVAVDTKSKEATKELTFHKILA